jgi:hypothetical protein
MLATQLRLSRRPVATAFAGGYDSPAPNVDRRDSRPRAASRHDFAVHVIRLDSQTRVEVRPAIGLGPQARVEFSACAINFGSGPRGSNRRNHQHHHAATSQRHISN